MWWFDCMMRDKTWCRESGCCVLRVMSHMLLSITFSAECIVLLICSVFMVSSLSARFSNSSSISRWVK